MKYVYDGDPKHEARLCFRGCNTPIYLMDNREISRFKQRPIDMTAEEEQFLECLKYKISDLDISQRTKTICSRANIVTLGDLSNYSKLEFSSLHNAGAGTVKTVEEMLASFGLSFREEEAPLRYRLPRNGIDYNSVAAYSCVY